VREAEDGLDYKTIVVAERGPIRTITLNRPERRNAMTPAMQMELIAALEEAAQSNCRVLVLAGPASRFVPVWIYRAAGDAGRERGRASHGCGADCKAFSRVV